MPHRNFGYKHSRLKQLRAFCYAAQTGSVSRAAEQMFLSQPSISLLIKSLETDLGDQLFSRNGPRIALTEQGQILLELALPLIEGLEILPEMYSERCNHIVGGKLIIAATESAILYILPNNIKEFRETYPGIELVINNVTGRDGLEMLRNGTADILISSLVEVPNDIIYIPTYTYDPVLITPVNHPLTKLKEITIRDIGAYDLILPPSYLSSWRVLDLIFRQHDVSYTVALEAGGWEVIKKYVELGLGVSIISSLCLTGEEKLVELPLKKYFPQRTYGVILRRGKYLSPATRRFIEMFDDSALAQIEDQNRSTDQDAA